MLKKTPVVLIDEATSNIDPQLDSKIQELFRTELKDCTVLTIAHRINTIVNYDKILVLDEGEVAEFDKPEKLLANKDSLFFKLWEQHEEAASN